MNKSSTTAVTDKGHKRTNDTVAAPDSTPPASIRKGSSFSIANATTPASFAAGSTRIVVVLSLYVLLVTALFHDTVLSMVAIWLRSDTYTHGFLIPPISLYLTWRLRNRFRALDVRPEPRVLVVTLGTGLVWLFANMVDVNVVQQLAYVAMLVSGIWAIVGNAAARCFAFPLGFLFLAVPMGSGLIPPLMEFTADTIEFLLRASGIPVLREGMFLYLPTGTWSVIEECSGLNYVIASVTLGLCYAHLSYTSLWRKIAFTLAAIVAPIIANGLRAYLTVLVGHLSDMRYGTGYDHVVFGWILFGLVLLLIFWIGSFWQQPEEGPVFSGTDASIKRSSALSMPGVAVLALLCAACWPVLSYAMSRDADPVTGSTLVVASELGSWESVDDDGWRWRPSQSGADRELDRVYRTQSGDESTRVGVHLRQYLQQEQGTELVDTSLNPWRLESGNWQVASLQQLPTDLEAPRQVTEAQVTGDRDDLLVWSWYRIDSKHTSNQYLVKILESKQQLFHGHRRGTRIFVATPLTEDRSQARQILSEFITDTLAAIESGLDSGITDQSSPTSGDLTEGTGE